MVNIDELRKKYEELTNPPSSKEIKLEEITTSMFYIDEQITDLKEQKEMLKQQAEEISNGR